MLPPTLARQDTRLDTQRAVGYKSRQRALLNSEDGQWYIQPQLCLYYLCRFSCVLLGKGVSYDAFRERPSCNDIFNSIIGSLPLCPSFFECQRWTGKVYCVAPLVDTTMSAAKSLESKFCEGQSAVKTRWKESCPKIDLSWEIWAVQIEGLSFKELSPIGKFLRHESLLLRWSPSTTGLLVKTVVKRPYPKRWKS